MLKSLRPLMLAACLLASVPPVALADEVSNYVKDGVAIGGTDPVAYFTVGKPVAGLPELATEWNGVTWHFSSAANRDAFMKEPARFAPQYGGYCAVGASYGKKIPIDSAAWKIVGGKLYLNSGEKAQSLFLSDEAATISRADASWPKIEQIPAGKL